MPRKKQTLIKGRKLTADDKYVDNPYMYESHRDARIADLKSKKTLRRPQAAELRAYTDELIDEMTDEVDAYLHNPLDELKKLPKKATGNRGMSKMASKVMRKLPSFAGALAIPLVDLLSGSSVAEAAQSGLYESTIGLAGSTEMGNAELPEEEMKNRAKWNAMADSYKQNME